MILHDTPGVWIPLTQGECAWARELREEIAELAQSACGGSRHQDRLCELSLLIGSAAVGAVVAETEGPDARKTWRAKHGPERAGAGDLLILYVRHAWHRWRQGKAKAQAVAQGKVIVLHEHGNERKPR